MRRIHLALAGAGTIGRCHIELIRNSALPTSPLTPTFRSSARLANLRKEPSRWRDSPHTERVACSTGA
jgi:hypothetical protein